MEQIPDLHELQKYSIERGRGSIMGATEVLGWTLYDREIYPAGGTTGLEFFVNPCGEGIASAPGSCRGQKKTQNDTNLYFRSQISETAMFLVRAVQVVFYAGGPGLDGQYDSQKYFVATNEKKAKNDERAFYDSGRLKFMVGSKPYFKCEPLRELKPSQIAWRRVVPQKGLTRKGGDALISYTANDLACPVLIQGGGDMAFGVSILWPGLVPLPSGCNARVGVNLKGLLYRPVQ